MVEAKTNLQAEWESFEAMIRGTSGDATSSSSQTAIPDLVTYPGLNVAHTADSKLTQVSKDDNAEKPVRSRSSLTEESDDEEKSRRKSRVSSASSSGSESGSRSSSSSAERKSVTADGESPSRRKSTASTGSVVSPKRSRSRSSERKSRSPEKEKSKSRSPSVSKAKRSKSRSPKRRRSRSGSRSRRRGSRSRHSRRRRSSDRKDRNRRRSSKSRRRRRSRSRSRNRRHGKSRRSSRDRRRSKDHRRRSRSRDRKRRSHRSRSRSRDRKHRRRSRSHSRGRTRSRSRSRDRRHRSPLPSDLKPTTFKEQMRQELLKAGKILHGEDDGKTEVSSDKPVQFPVSTKEFLKTIAVTTAATGVTPQMALLETMAAMHKKAQEITGIPVPKYYNPAAVNPLKYAEQVQKRKLLWSKAKDHKEEKEKEWQGSTFTADQDGKVSAKFRKLMGIKEGEGGSETGDTHIEMTEEQKRKQEELFSRLDKEYEFARMTTHTQRGVGLGFSSHPIYPAGSGGGGAT